jgi:uncharacterized membrane protein YeaQ/YmgE (transglycosylase-associated protein family)
MNFYSKITGTEHFRMMGLNFPDSPVNGAIWGLWSLFFAVFLYLLNQQFRFWATALIGWFGAFVLMWIVSANLGFLPVGVLAFAIPLSLLESIIAVWIISKFSEK